MDLSLQSLQVSWDSYSANDMTLEDIDMGKVRKFIEKVNKTGRFHLSGEPLDDLKKLKLVRKENLLTNAAWLLFGKGDIGYNVHMGRLKTPSFIIDDRMFNGSLFETVEEAMKYIISQLKVAFEIKGSSTQRTEIFEYPLPALREILLNSLIHRDYMSPVDIQIKIFDNKITCFNPGGLFGGLTLADLKGDSYQAQTRNKLIAEAFYLTGDIEKYGSGFVRIRDEIAAYPTMKLDFREKSGGFLVTLGYLKQKVSAGYYKSYDVPVMTVNEPAVEYRKNVTENVTENLSVNQKKIIEAIKGNAKVSLVELAAILGIARTNVIRNIKILRKRGLLERIGPDKGGYWKVKEK